MSPPQLSLSPPPPLHFISILYTMFYWSSKCVCVRVCVFVCMHLCVYVCVCVRACVRACVRVYSFNSSSHSGTLKQEHLKQEHQQAHAQQAQQPRNSLAASHSFAPSHSQQLPSHSQHVHTSASPRPRNTTTTQYTYIYI
jgi:hypothetical protein